MNTFKALVKREYWEHKGSMFLTPTIMAGFFAVLTIIMLITLNNITEDGHNFSVLSKMPEVIEQIDRLSDEVLSARVQAALYAPIVIFGFVMVLVSAFYTLGCLYDERKDRSILFWKSLPVSDLSTVLSKFAAVILMIPVFYFLALLAFQIYLLLFGTVMAWFGGSTGIVIWGASNLFVVAFNCLLGLVISSLWLAPLWGWFMFASAWARKVAILWGTLPIALIAVAEGTLFNSADFIEMVGRHIGKGFIVAVSSISALEEADGDMEVEMAGSVVGLEITHPFGAFGVADFWIGLAIAAAFLAGAIFIRRHRDEA